MKEIQFPSILAEGVQVVENILAEATADGFDETAMFAIRLALDEAMANAIRHGNLSDAAKKITVQYEVTADQFRVTICDEGEGFSPDDVPDPTLDENLERPSGRGVMLMRAYMDEILYSGGGNCVTMIKHNAPA